MACFRHGQKGGWSRTYKVALLVLNAGPAEGSQVSRRYESIHLQLHACRGCATPCKLHEGVPGITQPSSLDPAYVDRSSLSLISLPDFGASCFMHCCVVLYLALCALGFRPGLG